MEQLIHIVGKIDVIKHPAFVLPHFVISPDTCNLENVFHWLQIWRQNYNDWYENIKDHCNDQEILRREMALQKLIKSSHKNIEDYPAILARWARVAADFPTFDVTIKGVKMEIADYWEDIIIKCAKEEAIFQIPTGDLTELILHCEDNVINEGLYGIALMRHLRKGAQRQENYLGLGDIAIAGATTSYRILKPTESAADANIQSMIDAAPAQAPNKKDYPNLISFIKAQARWNIAQNYTASASSSQATQATQKVI